MKKFLSIILVLILTAAAFGNGVSLNSPGTRAISMGGAYISIADDYSAPYWNPAGLMNIEGFQASIFLTDIIPLASYERTMPWGEKVDANAETQHILAPNASFLWACKFSEKVHLGLSVIVPAGLGVKWKGEDLKAFNGPEYLGIDPGTGSPIPNPGRNNTFDWEGYIHVLNFSLSAAYKFSDRLNLGAAFHLVNGVVEIHKGVDALDCVTNPVSPAPGNDGMVDTQFDEESDGWGYGLGFGAQYKAAENVTLGASLRTRMSINFEGEAENPLMIPTKSDFKREITWPLWIGGGVAVQATDKLLMAVEIQWSQWSVTEDELTAEYDNATWEALMAASGGNKIVLKWRDQTQMRFGAEYLLNEKWALRGGYYLDPAPGPDNTQTIILPNTHFDVVTAGVGYKIDKWTFDLAFEYLKGRVRNIEESSLYENMPGKHGLNIIVSSFAVTYKFK